MSEWYQVAFFLIGLMVFLWLAGSFMIYKKDSNLILPAIYLGALSIIVVPIFLVRKHWERKLLENSFSLFSLVIVQFDNALWECVAKSLVIALLLSRLKQQGMLVKGIYAYWCGLLYGLSEAVVLAISTRWLSVGRLLGLNLFGFGVSWRFVVERMWATHYHALLILIILLAFLWKSKRTPMGYILAISIFGVAVFFHMALDLSISLITLYPNIKNWYPPPKYFLPLWNITLGLIVIAIFAISRRRLVQNWGHKG